MDVMVTDEKGKKPSMFDICLQRPVTGPLIISITNMLSKRKNLSIQNSNYVKVSKLINYTYVAN